jgi:hypothetical protein
MYRPSTYQVVTYFPTYLPIYETYFPTFLPTYETYFPTFLPIYETYFPTYLPIYETYFPTYLPIYETYFPTELVTKVKPKINSVKVHPQLSSTERASNGWCTGTVAGKVQPASLFQHYRCTMSRTHTHSHTHTHTHTMFKALSKNGVSLGQTPKCPDPKSVVVCCVHGPDLWVGGGGGESPLEWKTYKTTGYYCTLSIFELGKGKLVITYNMLTSTST